MRVMVEIGRNIGLVGISQNAFQLAFRRASDSLVDFFDGRFPVCFEGQIDNRHVWGRHSNGNPVESACKHRQHQADGSRRARRCGNH